MVVVVFAVKFPEIAPLKWRELPIRRAAAPCAVKPVAAVMSSHPESHHRTIHVPPTLA